MDPIDASFQIQCNCNLESGIRNLESKKQHNLAWITKLAATSEIKHRYRDRH
jgi:hypothetical protein